MKAPIYNEQGQKSREVELPEEVFGLAWNGDLVHQVVTGMRANARTPVAHTKDRTDVRGGGKKPWRQKGTGQARHGSNRSPIWRGGGITFGPRNEKDYTRKINKKMRAKAFRTVLAQKYRDGELIFLERLAPDSPRTKDARQTLEAISRISGYERLGAKTKNAALLALGNANEAAVRSFRNLENVAVGEARNLNALELLQHTYVVITEPETVFQQWVGSHES